MFNATANIGQQALTTPVPNSNAGTPEPLWGGKPGNNSGTAKPGETTPGKATDTPPGVSKGNVPATDIAKAKDAMLSTADQILKQCFATLGLKYTPPKNHYDRVVQAEQVVQKLTGKPRDDFLQAMEAAGKDFGINFGLKRGEGSERKAINFGDAAFKGVDGEKRREVQTKLQEEVPKPKAEATSETSPATTETAGAGDTTASTSAKVSDQLFAWAPKTAGKESFTLDEFKAFANEAIGGAPKKLKGAAAELLGQVLGQFDANASEGKVSKEALAQLIDTTANAAPQSDAAKPDASAGTSTAAPEAQLAAAKKSVSEKLLPALGAGDKTAFAEADIKTISANLKILPAEYKSAVQPLQKGLADLVSKSNGKDVEKRRG